MHTTACLVAIEHKGTPARMGVEMDTRLVALFAEVGLGAATGVGAAEATLTWVRCRRAALATGVCAGEALAEATLEAEAAVGHSQLGLLLAAVGVAGAATGVAAAGGDGELVFMGVVLGACVPGVLVAAEGVFAAATGVLATTKGVLATGTGVLAAATSVLATAKMGVLAAAECVFSALRGVLAAGTGVLAMGFFAALLGDLPTWVRWDKPTFATGV